MSPGTTVVALPTHDVHALTWGPDDGPLLLALHGFPDTAWTYRRIPGIGWEWTSPLGHRHIG